MLKTSEEALGVALKLCWGNEKYEDINRVHIIQTQQAFQEGADSGAPRGAAVCQSRVLLFNLTWTSCSICN